MYIFIGWPCIQSQMTACISVCLMCLIYWFVQCKCDLRIWSLFTFWDYLNQSSLGDNIYNIHKLISQSGSVHQLRNTPWPCVWTSISYWYLVLESTKMLRPPMLPLLSVLQKFELLLDLLTIKCKWKCLWKITKLEIGKV